MPTEERSTAVTTPVLDGPQWRALLEARWQARLEELTELSLAYHAGAGGEAGPTGSSPVHHASDNSPARACR